MRDTEESAAREGLRHGALDLLVRLHVNRRGGFVADDNAGVANECAGESEELSEAELVLCLNLETGVGETDL